MATSIGTRRFFERPRLLTRPGSARPLGRTGWQTGAVGFGGYRLETEAHGRALRKAVLGGCNLIDTGPDYGRGTSERLVGRVLAELFAEGEVRRDGVILATQAGSDLRPEVLRERITGSLDRLRLERIDLFLLQRPEEFFRTEGDHLEYYRRLETAFRHLEDEARAGRIQYYGVASESLVLPKETEDYTSLETLLEIADRIGPAHRFAAIQFPLNLFESEAALEANNSGRTVLELARARGLATITQRPLNAFRDGRLIRLADFPVHPGIADEFKAAMNGAGLLESQYAARSIVPAREIAWAHHMRAHFSKLTDLEAWNGFRRREIEPVLGAALDRLRPSPHAAWAQDYETASLRLFRAMTAYLEDQASAEADRVALSLDALCPELAQCPTLSQKALRVLNSLSGVDCILVGMRQTEYVLDALGLLPPVPAETALEVLRRLAELPASNERNSSPS